MCILGFLKNVHIEGLEHQLNGAKASGTIT